MTDGQLAGQTLLVIGGSSGIGLETARRARMEGAHVILTARNAQRVHGAGLELQGSIAAFDATDFERLRRFFTELRAPIDHVVVSGPRPYAAPLATFDVEEARSAANAHLLLPLEAARNAAGKVRAGGTVLFLGCSESRLTTPAITFASALTTALCALLKNLALELSPVRVNVIAARPGDLPVDVAVLALQLMTNPGITGQSFVMDGSRQLIDRQ